MNGCPILELKPKSPIRFKIYVGGAYFGDVVRCSASKYSASHNGISYAGSNPRAAAVAALCASAWAAIRGPVMAAAAAAEAENSAFVEMRRAA